MRAYFFGNMYLSSIQQGIQAAHVTHELFTSWTVPSIAQSNLLDWAKSHKTMILLNGGYAETIQELTEFFAEQGEQMVEYPWADFHEEEASLNGALTCTGIILTEKIYKTAAALRSETDGAIRNTILDHGEIRLYPEGDVHGIGIDIEPDQQGVLYFTKWEFQLMERLNQFSLAS